MKGREHRGAGGAPPADLLVCFPSRARLTLSMPKPICSPARHSDSTKKRHPHHYSHHLNTSITRGGGGGGGGGGHGSPLLWAMSSKQIGGAGSEMEEPTSPKVTCAGQIKIRPQSSACRNWQSVMEEIEKIHNDRKLKKRPGWAESFGFKKDIMSFLACLRSVRLDFRCFGSFPEPEISSSDEEDEEEDDDELGQEDNRENRGPRIGENGKLDADVGDDSMIDDASTTVFSKWFMVLQGNNRNDSTNAKPCGKLDERTLEGIGRSVDQYDDCGSSDLDVDRQPSAPPPNALLLMRCRSAPAAKGWQQLEEIGRERKTNEAKLEEQKELVLLREKVAGNDAKKLVEDREKKRKRVRKSLAIVMKYDTDFYELSSDHIAKETWVAGGFNDPLSRSRSWKR